MMVDFLGVPRELDSADVRRVTEEIQDLRRSSAINTEKTQMKFTIIKDRRQLMHEERRGKLPPFYIENLIEFFKIATLKTPCSSTLFSFFSKVELAHLMGLNVRENLMYILYISGFYNLYEQDLSLSEA